MIELMPPGALRGGSMRLPRSCSLTPVDAESQRLRASVAGIIADLEAEDGNTAYTLTAWNDSSF